MMRISIFLPAVLAIPFLAACDAREAERLGNSVGAQLGTLAGNTLGRPVGGSIGRDIARTGRSIGASVGGSMGRLLSQADQRQAGLATSAALNNAQGGSVRPVGWSSDTGTGASGTAAVVGTARPGQSCYDVRQVAVVPGQGQVEQVQRYCSAGDGRWEVA